MLTIAHCGPDVWTYQRRVKLLSVALKNFDNEAKNNNFWLSTIVRVDGDRRARNAEIVRHAEYEAVTAQDVMRLAQKYLRDETAIHIKVVPTAKASAR